MINSIFKNKSGGGQIKIVAATALDYRAQYLDDNSVEFSVTREDLHRYFELKESAEEINQLLTTTAK